MRFGVCYYPEQWPEDRWQLDGRMMRESGFDLVRIGEFAWSSYEPARGEFHWDWLDRAIGLLAGEGLQIVLCTPTATPPVWLARERPEILSVGSDGRRRAYGSRRHTCPTSPAYREEGARVVEALVQRYGSNPAVVAWQVDNEPGNHDSSRCWCDFCQEGFSSWLAERYGSIGELNLAWANAFWSQTYPDFEAVRLPVPTMTSHHPSLRLAHRRFASDTVIAGLAEQYRIIGEGSGGRDITTNVYSGDIDIDARSLARLGGIYAVDSYPHGVQGPLDVAMTLDRRPGGTRTRLWVMEQQIGPINWGAINPPVPTGQVRAWIFQAALHGVEAMFFFRWRAARGGQEQYHSGLLRHDGSASEALSEVAATVAELRSIDLGSIDLGSINLGSTNLGSKDLGSVDLEPSSRVAVLFSTEDAWLVDIDPHRQGLTHRSLVLASYIACRAVGLEVALVDPEDDLTGYPIVLAPALLITTPGRVAALERTIAAGNLVILGPRSLVMDDEGVFVDHASPSGLAQALGGRVVEHLSQPFDLPVEPWSVPSGTWTDVLESERADVIAHYGGDGHLAGRAAAIRNGNVVYAGFSSVEAWTNLLAGLTDRTAGLAEVESFPAAGWQLNHREFVVRELA